jgi:DNA repair protein RecO (recombination protein O)
VRETFYPLREDVDRFAVGSAMLALSQHAVQASEPNPELFSLLYHGLSFLCYGESAPIDIGLCFATRYVRTAGFCPVITSCAACGADLRAMRTLCFDSGAGGVLCDDCAKRSLETRDVSCLTLEAMRRMLLLEDKDMDRVRLPDTVRRELLALLEQYCAHVFERESRPLTALRKLLPSE